MKRLCPTWIALMAITIPASSQITVTNSVFPVVGDTLHYAFGNQPNAISAVYTPPGGGQLWDLSGLQADSTWDAIYRNPATGVASAAYPGADLMLTPAGALPGQEDYLNVTATEVAYMGSHGVDPLKLGSSWRTHLLPTEAISYAPLNYFDIRQATANIPSHIFPASEMPPAWTAQWPQVDSVRMDTEIRLQGIVDAWGTLTIPGGTYAVLREKRLRISDAIILARTHPPWIWNDVEDVSEPYLMDPTVVWPDTTRTWHYINALTKETIAICELNNAENQVIRVQYRIPASVTPVAVRVAIKALLEGPAIAGTFTMQDVLRANGSVPLAEPYTALGYGLSGGGGAATTAPVLSATGSNAIVDWVIVELRSALAPATVVASKAALIQKDGDVVAVDGATPVTLNVAPGNYFVSLRHRNHLGVMTATALPLTYTPTAIDLTLSTTATYGTAARKNAAGIMLMWAGDVNFNGQVKYTGSSNDRDPILVSVGSTTPNNVVGNTYSTRDVNMNGQVKYTGSGNDRDPLLINVGSTTPNNLRLQQLP